MTGLPAPATDPGGRITLRPRSAPLLSAAVWALCAVLAVDALARAGTAGARDLPFLALVAALVWAVLWRPRVILQEDAAEVRNPLRTEHLPFEAVAAVRVGAMLRFDVEGTGGTRTVTAWNGPGLSRGDSPLRRAAEARGVRAGARAPGTAERLVREQEASASAVVRRRWERWRDERDTRGAGPARSPERRIAVVPLAVVGACALACAALLI